MDDNKVLCSSAVLWVVLYVFPTQKESVATTVYRSNGRW